METKTKRVIPLSCKGEVCTIRGCKELASHIVVEVNAYDMHTQLEEYIQQANPKKAQKILLCDSHFEYLFTKEIKGIQYDERNFEGAQLKPLTQIGVRERLVRKMAGDPRMK